jgi:hypothetical protein
LLLAFLGILLERLNQNHISLFGMHYSVLHQFVSGGNNDFSTETGLLEEECLVIGARSECSKTEIYIGRGKPILVVSLPRGHGSLAYA